ncbi:MAG: hypothetical protein ACRD3J_30855, partial [Thermoanaerobaculia bacterium]
MSSLRRFTLLVVLTAALSVSIAVPGCSQGLPAQSEPASIVINGDPPPSRVGKWQTVVPLPNGGAIGEVLGMQ